MFGNDAWNSSFKVAYVVIICSKIGTVPGGKVDGRAAGLASG